MIVIFYMKTDPHMKIHNPPQPGFYLFQDSEFSFALNKVQSLREQGMHHVVMSNEPTDMVGKPGVSAVVDGKTPDGEDYEWSKAGRAGKMRNPDAPVRNGKDL